ncbi:MAG: hypothetical protein ACKPKO_20615, partial [Candidatus Fonsibacter sp.]
RDDKFMGVPAIAREAEPDRPIHRLDLNSGVFVVSYGQTTSDRWTGSDQRDGSSMWIPEAASCLNSAAPVNNNVDSWLIDTGCGYDLISRNQAEKGEEVDPPCGETTDIPDSQWSDHCGQGGQDDH